MTSPTLLDSQLLKSLVGVPGVVGSVGLLLFAQQVWNLSDGMTAYVIGLAFLAWVAQLMVDRWPASRMMAAHRPPMSRRRQSRYAPHLSEPIGDISAGQGRPRQRTPGTRPNRDKGLKVVKSRNRR